MRCPGAQLLWAISSNERRDFCSQACGAGLRLMGILRPRGKDRDFDRLELVVRAGKGNKDRGTVLPEALVPGLRLAIDRTRRWFERDRMRM